MYSYRASMRLSAPSCGPLGLTSRSSREGVPSQLAAIFRLEARRKHTANVSRTVLAAAEASRSEGSKSDKSVTDLDEILGGCSSTPAVTHVPSPLGTNGQGAKLGQQQQQPDESKPAAGPAATTVPPASSINNPHASATGQSIIKSFHIIAFFTVLGLGLAFLTVLLVSTGDMQFRLAATKVVKRLLKTHALRQVLVILSAMLFVRFGLEPLVKSLRTVFRAQGVWEKSTEFFVLREVYRPLEVLFLIAAAVTLAENFLPQLIAIPRSLVQSVVRSTLSLTFVIALVRVVYNIKGRMFREMAWQLEVKGDVTRQRRIEAIDKLMSVFTLIVGSVFGFQALGLDINSVLTIGGIGGLAVGLAGREILENLFTGLIILSSSPFEVGDEILFRPSSGQVIEGIVLDVGWYRTTIRSFEREIFCIPNAAFSRNVVLNITRKGREWRFYEFIGLRVEDMKAVGPVVADMRKIIRQDPRIIQKLHRRVFLDKVTREQVTLYVSFYVEANNRDAFMAIKQDLMLAFVDCVERNGAKLARQRVQLEFVPSIQPTLGNGSAGTGSDTVTDDKYSLPAPVDVPATAAATPSVPASSAPAAAAAPASTPTSASAAAATTTTAGSASTVTPSAGNTAIGSAAGSRPTATGPAKAKAAQATATTSAASAAVSSITSTATLPKVAPQAAGQEHTTETTMGRFIVQPSNFSQVAAAAAAAAALTPDDILSSNQDGVLVTGSWDDL